VLRSFRLSIFFASLGLAAGAQGAAVTQQRRENADKDGSTGM
jgi:hypothetical protein